MIWSETLQSYCERTDAGFWSEPLNALSNIAFIFSAFFVATLLKHAKRTDDAVLLLIIILIFVGIGSFIFHTMATRWAEMLDILPIASFVVFYFIFGLKRFFDMQVKRIGLFFLIFASSLYVVVKESHLFNGSILYAPALITLWLFVIGMIMKGAAARNDRACHQLSLVLLAGGACIFAVSLLFRTLDQRLCDQITVGTHFIWHLLNALVLYLLTAALIVYRDKSVACFMMSWFRRRPAKTPTCQ